MNFIDHTGHIFSIEHYSSYPIGYEYNECPYIFWLSDEYSSQLSVDCFYIKPIRLLLEGKPSTIHSIDIFIKNSSNFSLLASKAIEDAISKNKNPLDYISLNYASSEALEYYESKGKDTSEINDFSNSISIDIAKEAISVYDNNYYWINDNQEKIKITNENDIKVEKLTLGEIVGKLLGDGNVKYLLNENGCTFGINIDGINYSRSIKILLLKYIVENPSMLESMSDEDLDRLIIENESTYSNKTIEIDGIEHIVSQESTEFSLVTFYVIGSASEFGTWSTNVLIHAKTDTLLDSYCPITVGGVFVDECEELAINGKNMGISLPKDICRALHNSSFWNETPNMSLWNQKVKEYLMNYMKLHCERGNFQSAINALKWFGYGNKIKLYSLIQTDNEFIEQYILNNFDIQSDVISEFKHFRNSTLLSLSIPAVVESDEINLPNFSNDFWGECKPKTKDLFDATEVAHYDEGDIDFVKPLYDWSFNELALKLCALKHYYQKFFLPIHLNIHRASLTTQCFAGDIKLLSKAKALITESSIYAINNSTTVKFPDSSTVWLSEQCRLVDENWIEDNAMISKLEGNLELTEMVFYDIVDNCFSVSITLINKAWKKEGDSQMFYCKLFAYQDATLMKESTFTISSEYKEYPISFVIYPKALNTNFDINFWLSKKYSILLLCNGVWHTYKFKIALPELDIEVGKLKYAYDDRYKQFSGFNGNKPVFNTFMHLPEMVSINNINFANEICEAMENENMKRLDKEYFEDELMADKVYYFYYNDKGNKVVVCTGGKSLVNENGKYTIKYSKQDKEGIQELSDIIGDRLVYSSVYKNIESYVNLYSIQAHLPTNKDFMNKVWIFDLFDKKSNKVKYSDVASGNEGNNDWSLHLGKYAFYDNDSSDVKDLYLNIFNDNGDWTNDLMYWDEQSSKWKATTKEKQLYDIYLMHDFEYWYAIMISKKTIGSSKELDSVYEIYNSGSLSFRRNRSDEKFLVNRMAYVSMDGVYHFNPKDMIVAKLNNFDNLPFKLKIGSRWNFYPLGIGSTVEDSFSSPTNIGIMSIKSTDVAHSEGYYSVQANYSIDNFANHSQTRKTKILISSKF